MEKAPLPLEPPVRLTEGSREGGVGFREVEVESLLSEEPEGGSREAKEDDQPEGKPESNSRGIVRMV